MRIRNARQVLRRITALATMAAGAAALDCDAILGLAERPPEPDVDAAVPQDAGRTDLDARDRADTANAPDAATASDAEGGADADADLDADATTGDADSSSGQVCYGDGGSIGDATPVAYGSCADPKKIDGDTICNEYAYFQHFDAGDNSACVTSFEGTWSNSRCARANEVFGCESVLPGTCTPAVPTQWFYSPQFSVSEASETCLAPYEVVVFP